ncbi:hypothetical protein [Acidithrix sp. C25]|uniref:hypothetical protein n=1 Tax=Acidithrix sp. C25 TaxID=1671482 RepID=UPI00191BC5C3|nr:hypothetical protein [Acidithrix sp. C25]CAG4916291.1 unnamed protein product [Acidithrix sp. C25]
MIVAASPDGKVLYVVTSGPNGYEIETISLTSNPPTISNTTNLPSGTPTDIAISPDGSHLGVTLNTSASQNVSTGEVAIYQVNRDVIQSSTAPAIIPIATTIPNSLAMSNSSVFVTPSAITTKNNKSFYNFSSFDIASGNANYTTALTHLSQNSRKIAPIGPF